MPPDVSILVNRSRGRANRFATRRSECSQVLWRRSSVTDGKGSEGWECSGCTPENGSAGAATYNRLVRVVITGCGRVGREVALALSAAGDDVSVVDDNEEAFELLGKSFDGTFHLGRAYDVDVLREAGAGEADVVLAVTDSDNANLMTVQVAERVFGAPKAIALLADPAREEAYRALDVAFVAGARLVAQVLVERVHEPDFAFHLSFPTGEVQVVEMELGAAAEEITVSRLEIEGLLRVAAVQRDGRVFIPADEEHLRSGDLVVASVRRGVAGRIAKYLAEEHP